MEAIKCEVVWSWVGKRAFLQNDLIPPTPILLGSCSPNESRYWLNATSLFIFNFRPFRCPICTELIVFLGRFSKFIKVSLVSLTSKIRGGPLTEGWGGGGGGPCSMHVQSEPLTIDYYCTILTVTSSVKITPTYIYVCTVKYDTRNVSTESCYSS